MCAVKITLALDIENCSWFAFISNDLFTPDSSCLCQLFFVHCLGHTSLY